MVEAHGIGYAVLVSTEDYGRLGDGEPIKLYIHEHIRDSAYDLYGFSQLDSKRLFEQLLEVSGIGPKMALAILNLGTANAVRQAIAAGNTSFIQGATGVGKRVAERIVVELKDKVGLVSSADESALFVGAAQAEQDEAVQALMSLGYGLQDATKALARVDKQLNTQERIKQALRSSVP